MIFGFRSRLAAVLVACLFLGGLPSGCSYLFVTAPKDEAYGVPVAGDCTTNPTAPIIDSLLTATNLISTLYVAGEDNVTNKGQAVGVGILATGLWLSSAIYGYYNTSHCSALRYGDEPGPYRRPVRTRQSVLSGPPRPPAPPAYPAPPVGGENGVDGTAVPAAPANAAPPPVPAVPQQPDEDDPGHRRRPIPTPRPTDSE